MGRIEGAGLGKAGWGALVGITGLYFGLKLELALRFWTRPETASTMLLGGLLQLMSLGIVVLAMFGIDGLNQGFERMGVKGGLEKIGKMSLQFYLLHNSVASVLEPASWPWWGKVATLYAATYGLAWILWRATGGISLPLARGSGGKKE